MGWFSGLSRSASWVLVGQEPSPYPQGRWKYQCIGNRVGSAVKLKLSFHRGSGESSRHWWAGEVSDEFECDGNSTTKEMVLFGRQNGRIWARATATAVATSNLPSAEIVAFNQKLLKLHYNALIKNYESSLMKRSRDREKKKERENVWHNRQSIASGIRGLGH